MMNKAPHPNAARVFVNWTASKEGLEIFARASASPTTRNDIDELSFAPPEIIPRPGVKYFDTSAWDFTVTGKEKARLFMKDLLKR
jgi:ABC-type Fe3+ transport system substrate-binding protein